MKKLKNVFYFDSVQDATEWLIKVDGNSFDVHCAGDGSYAYLIDALSSLQKSLSRARNSDAVVSWHNIGPGSAHVELSNAKSIPIVSGSLPDRLSKLLDGMDDGTEMVLDPAEFPHGYVRAVLSSKGFSAHTKTKDDGLYLVKGQKSRSDAQIIRDAVEAIRGSSAEIELPFDPAYVRTIISKMANGEYRFSVKHFPARGSFLVSKVYYDAQRNNEAATGDYSREYVEAVLNPAELMAYDAILAKLRVAETGGTASKPLASSYVPAAPVGAPVTSPAPTPQPLTAEDFFPDVTPAPEPAKKRKFDYDTRNLEDIIASDDRDTYDAKALDTSNVEKIFGDDEDIPF